MRPLVKHAIAFVVTFPVFIAFLLLVPLTDPTWLVVPLAGLVAIIELGQMVRTYYLDPEE
jgi:nucleoside recognition membrane protein YjiH